jgi:hypothetical protein
LVAIYDPNNDNTDFFQSLQSKMCLNENTSVIVVGDWNVVQNYDKDTINYQSENNRRAQVKVHQMMNDLDLIDIWRMASEIGISYRSDHLLVGDSSAIRRLFSTCCSRGTSESSTYGKHRICLSNSWSAHFHVSWLSDCIFYQKPLYKSLHQSFVYSFITILSSESGVTPHYSTILP